MVSFRNPDRPVAELSAEESREAELTYYVHTDTSKWPLAHLRVLLTRPQAYLSGLILAVCSFKWNFLQLARHLRFFAEAVIAGEWAQDLGIQHLHTHFRSLTAMLINRISACPFPPR